MIGKVIGKTRDDDQRKQRGNKLRLEEYKIHEPPWQHETADEDTSNSRA